MYNDCVAYRLKLCKKIKILLDLVETTNNVGVLHKHLGSKIYPLCRDFGLTECVCSKDIRKSSSDTRLFVLVVLNVRTIERIHNFFFVQNVCRTRAYESLVFGTLSVTPRLSRSSLISVVPCSKRLKPRGSPRHDDKFIELRSTQFVSISFTASNDTDDPHRFRWLLSWRMLVKFQFQTIEN